MIGNYCLVKCIGYDFRANVVKLVFKYKNRRDFKTTAKD